MSIFWQNFWSNFLANISVVSIVSILGYLAKGSIAKNLKRFIDKEVADTMSVIASEKKKEREKHGGGVEKVF